MHPNEVVRYAVNFTITGPIGASYLVQAPKSNSYAEGDNWHKNLKFQANYPPGTHEYSWYKQIPLDATAPDTAKMKVRLKLYDEYGLLELDRDTDSRTFDVVPY